MTFRIYFLIFQPYKFYHQQHLSRANRALSSLIELVGELGQRQLLRQCIAYQVIYWRVMTTVWVWFFKVEKILKGSLVLIPSPSPSVKIQIMVGKVCLRCKGKTFLDVVNKLLKTKSFLTSPSNVLSYYLK